MVLSTWYVFSCLPSTHCVSASRQQSPSSIPSHIPPPGSAVPRLHPHLPPAHSLSHVSAAGGCSCPALSHTHPLGLIPGVSKATLHSLPSPTQHLLVHNPRVVPAPSQTWTSLHVLVPSWKPFTMVVHKASLLHLLGPRDPCSERPGRLWMHFWSTVCWGLGGCCGVGVLQGRTWRGKPVTVPSSQSSGMGFLCLPITFEMVFASGTASSQAADPTHPSPVPAMVPVSYKSWVGAKHGQEVAKSPAPDLHQSRTQASHCLSLIHSLPQLPSVVV